MNELYEQLKRIDELEAIEKRFERACSEGGLAWAIECHADHVIFGRQLAVLTRPHINAYEETDAWFNSVKVAWQDARRRLIRRHGRHDSTSVLQNMINDAEAEAMSRFVEMLERFFI